MASQRVERRLARGDSADLRRRGDRATVYCGTDRWGSFILEAAHRFDLQPAWVRAVICVESAGCAITSQGPVTSSAGAMGLMQLMPATWSRLREQLHLGSDPYDPADNILAGVAYLRELYDAFGASGALAAYNAGPERYEQWLLAGRPLPAATLDYLDRIHEALARMDDWLLSDLSPVSLSRTPFVDRDAIPRVLDRRSLSGAAARGESQIRIRCRSFNNRPRP